MRKIMYFLILLSISSILLAGEKLEKEFKSAPGKKLKVDLNSGGSVEIFGWDKDLVYVKLEGRQDYLDDYNVDVEERAYGISVNVRHVGYDHGNGNLKLYVKVPNKFDLEIETMGGDVIIDGVEGEIEGETMGGELEFSNLKGQLDFTTMGGDIDLEDSDVDGELKTMGGEVQLKDVIGEIDASSMGGDIFYHNVKGRGSSGRESEVEISTMGGDIEVKSAPQGANVSTMGGEIKIGSAAKYVKASTMGGEIEIQELDGWVKASTMGGEVTVNMIGDPEKGKRDVDLSSMGGDIVLTVPAGLSMEFDIKLTYTKRARKDYKIISDFPINLEESDDWDYSNGSARKYIYGTGKVAGGKNLITIDTINGDIIIKKGSK